MQILSFALMEKIKKDLEAKGAKVFLRAYQDSTGKNLDYALVARWELEGSEWEVREIVFNEGSMVGR